MPPKRPRVVPSQTNLSVQDVRDYSTPDGAAMANEEMRRLKIAVQGIADAQAAAASGQDMGAPIGTGAGTLPPKPPVVATYKWFVKAKAYNPQPVNNNDIVEFIGQYGIDVFYQNPRKLYISAINYKWTVRTVDGVKDVAFNTQLGFFGKNGVNVTLNQSLGAVIIDRPLTIYQRSIDIGGQDTVGINFHNHSNYINKQEHDQIHFKIEDEGDGIRRVTGWYKSGAQTASLEGALSTVWIKDAAGDPAVGFGYNTATGAYQNALYVGPWGWQNAAGVTTPYNLSNYTNNVIDTQWNYGTSINFVPTQAFTRMGVVSKTGLYLISGTTQGYRWVSTECLANMTPYLNIRLHYYLVVRRVSDPLLRIYKTLDIDPWDLWATSLGASIEERQFFINRMSSLPWSLQGTTEIWLESGDEVCHFISFNPGNNGESRIGYQVTYHAFEGICIADAATIDPATQVNLTPINLTDPYLSYHQMQFNNV